MCLFLILFQIYVCYFIYILHSFVVFSIIHMQNLVFSIGKYQNVFILFGFKYIFSSPEPLAHGGLLRSLDVRRPSCVVRCQQLLLQTTSPPILLAGF